MSKIKVINVLLASVAVLFLMTGFAFAQAWWEGGPNDIYWDNGNVAIGTTNAGTYKLAVEGGPVSIKTNADSGELSFPYTNIGSGLLWGMPISIIKNQQQEVLSQIILISNIILFGDSSHNYLEINPNENKIKVDVLDFLVKNKIKAGEIIVEDTATWPDYVFEESYQLPSLDKVETYIKENKHLPDIPSEKEIKENGLSMSDMMSKQMQKIEELTLYVIELKKENQKLNERLVALEQTK